jgi:hypothetical protein
LARSFAHVTLGDLAVLGLERLEKVVDRPESTVVLRLEL